MVPFWEMEREFEALHPEVDVLIEGHGSIQVIRQVTELQAEADVIAVADYSLIPLMMYSTFIPESEKSYADWCIIFATNHLGIAYTALSKYANEINVDNWTSIISRPDVKVGISDPRFDSCGYRAVMTCLLAGLYYGDEGIFNSIMGKFSPPIAVECQNLSYKITVPQVLRPDRIALRGSSVALLATIESGDIDYAFMYQSVSEQHGLKFVALPAEIDLFSDDYQKLVDDLVVELSYQRFASVVPRFGCQRILYGVTIPNNATNREAAIEFVDFLLSEQGQTILQEQHQPPITPAQADNAEYIPEGLKLYLQ